MVSVKKGTNVSKTYPWVKHSKLIRRYLLPTCNLDSGLSMKDANSNYFQLYFTSNFIFIYFWTGSYLYFSQTESKQRKMRFNIEKALNGRSELSVCWPRHGSYKHLELNGPGPVWWRADIECRGPLVLCPDLLHHSVDRLLPEQGHGAAAKPAPGHAASEHPGNLFKMKRF